MNGKVYGLIAAVVRARAARDAAKVKWRKTVIMHARFSDKTGRKLKGKSEVADRYLEQLQADGAVTRTRSWPCLRGGSTRPLATG